MWLPERLLAVRNRVLSSPGFQRWAAGFPLTRWLARRRSRELVDLVAGFVYSQVLSTCVRLGLLDILAEGVQSTDHLAKRLDLPPDGARRLLRAAASLRLAEARGRDRFALGELGAALRGNPGISALLAHHPVAYESMRDPVALLRGEVPELEPLGRSSDVRATSSTLAIEEVAGEDAGLLKDSRRSIALDVLDAYSLEERHCLLGVAGGDGTFLVAAAKRWPHLNVILFDSPDVAERARAQFEREGLSDRATAISGDLTCDPLPQGADVVSLVSVLYNHDDSQAQSILQRTCEALPEAGRLLVAEPMSGTPGAEPIGDAYFGLCVLAMGGDGRPRTPKELEQMLRDTCFDRVRLLPTRRPILTQVVAARRSG